MIRSRFHLILLLLWPCTASAVDAASVETLLQEAGYSAANLKNLGDGYIARELKVDDPSIQLGVIGLMRLDSDALQLHDAFSRAARVLDGTASSIKRIELINEPIEDHALSGYVFSDLDRRTLKTCEVGRCRMKLPESVITRLNGRQADLSSDDFESYTPESQVSASREFENQ